MKKNDMLVILGVIVIAGAVLLWNHFVNGKEGAKAIVYVDGEESASYDLSENGVYEIQTEYGSNLLVIWGGKADVTEADCPDGLCVKQHSIDKTGETIVCLPHRVVVEIEGGQESNLDAVTQ